MECAFILVCAQMRSVSAVHHTTEKKAKSLSGTHTETQRRTNRRRDSYASRANGNVSRLRKVDTTVTGFVLVFALGFAAFAVPGLCVFECSLDLLTHGLHITRSRIHNLMQLVHRRSDRKGINRVWLLLHITYIVHTCLAARSSP